jgi:DNA-binding MarR family transcriptional regulator
MTNAKVNFQEVMDVIFQNEECGIQGVEQDAYADARKFWEDLKTSSTFSGSKSKLTPLGKQILEFLQSKDADSYTAKQVAEELFVAPRSVAGAMRKLCGDGYVDKTKGETVYSYSLTDEGREIDLNS